jgi:hypothetical protein
MDNATFHQGVKMKEALKKAGHYSEPHRQDHF